MKKTNRKIFIILLICAVILGSAPIWLPLPAKFLLVKDNFKKADTLVVLSGDWTFSRESKAVELYKNGLTGKIIRILERENTGFNWMKTALNLTATQEEAYTGFFEAKGVPKDAFIIGNEVATSTFSELKAAREIMLKNKFKSVILVTSDYHMFRALMTAKWVFRSDDIAIYTATAHTGGFNPNRWWLYEDGIRGVVFEYLCIFFYLTYHFMLGK